MQNFTNDVISTPFEDLKKLINATLSNYTFDASIFPVAQKKQLTFCSDNDTLTPFALDLVEYTEDVDEGAVAAA